MSYIGNPDTPDQPFSLASGVTITGYQVVNLNTSPTNPDDMEIQVPNDGTAYPLGIAQVDDNVSLGAGEVVAVRVWGPSKAIAAGAISVGAVVVPTTNGRVTSTDPSTGKWKLGIALTSAAQLGDELVVLIKPELNEA